MKYLLLLLLFPLFFYGQEDVYTEKVVLEGFYKYDAKNSEFYELYQDKVLQPVYLDIRNVEIPKNVKSTCLVKLKGKRLRKGIATREHYYHEQIIVSKIICVKDDMLLEDYLRKNEKHQRNIDIPYAKSDSKNRIIENIEYFEEEGFYSKGMEHSSFTVLQGDSLVGGSGWVTFDNYIQEIDSIRNIVEYKTSEVKRGVYMKVKGIKQSGGKYGHFGGSNYLLRVTNIEAIDTSRTRWGFIIDQIDRKKYFGGRKITYPDILKEGQEYTFKGKSQAYFDSTTVDVDSVYDISIKLKCKGAYLHYKYDVSYQGKILKNTEGRNIIDVNRLIASSEWKDEEDWVYEATSKEMMFESLSLFKITVKNRKDEQGRAVINIEDYTKYRGFFTLYREP